MPAKEHTPSGEKARATQRSPKPATEDLDGLAQQQIHPTTLLQQARLASETLSLRDVLHLQRVIGNRAVSHLLSGAKPRPTIQAKVTVGAAHDPYEQEADRVAAQVMAAPASTPTVQRLGDEDARLTKPRPEPHVGAEGGEAPPDWEMALDRARGGGQPLDVGLQRAMGQAMGADFSGVRVHTDAQSDQLNQSIQAEAFTTGQEVFFRQGAYDPGSRGGQALIAHELTHVVQQQPYTGNRKQIQRQLSKDAPINAAAVQHVDRIENPHGLVFILKDSQNNQSVVVKFETPMGETEDIFRERYQLSEEVASAVFGSAYIKKNTKVTDTEIATLKTLGHIGPGGATMVKALNEPNLIKGAMAIKMDVLSVGDNLFEMEFGSRLGALKKGIVARDRDKAIDIINLIYNHGKAYGKMAYYDVLVRNYDRFNIARSDGGNQVALKNIDFNVARTATLPLDNIATLTPLLTNPAGTLNEMTHVKGDDKKREYARSIIEGMFTAAYMPVPEVFMLEHVIEKAFEGIKEAEGAAEGTIKRWEQDLREPHRNQQRMRTKEVIVNRYRFARPFLPPPLPFVPLPPVPVTAPYQLPLG